MKQFKIVFLFELMGHLKSKAYIITTVVLALFVMALPLIPTIWGLINARPDELDTAVIIDTERFHDVVLLAEHFPGYQITFMDDIAAALEGVQDGTIAWVLEMDSPGSDTPVLHVLSIRLGSFNLQGSAQGYIREIYRRDILEYWGLSRNVIDDIFDVDLTVELSSAAGAAEMFLRDYIFAYGLAFMLYIAIVSYGGLISTSVVTEKSSKAMEILITAVKPLYLMFGKVLGVTVAGLLQMVILIAATTGSFIINGLFWVGLFLGGGESGEVDPALMQMIAAPLDPLIFVYFILFFILGFLIYAFIYASLASTVSRMEDANSMQMIPVMLLMAALFVTMFGLGNPGAGFITVLSYVPFLTPMLMLMRYTMGVAGHMEIWISIAFLVITVIALGYISAKIYRAGVLMYGKTPKVMEIIRLLFAADVR